MRIWLKSKTMKLLAVFNSLPDILYLWFDEGYLKHLKKTLSRDEFMKTLDLDSEDVRLDVIGQFFSPLIASQKYMIDTGDPYSSISGEDGSIIVIRQFDNLFYVSLCGDGEESEWFLQRRIHFFRYLVNALYGPSTDQLKPSSILQRQHRWQRLSSLLKTWHTLCQQEQMFLVEALERLNVNGHLNSTCLQLLGEALSKASKGSNAVHSLLLVNNKLLGLYSQPNAFDLKTSDILLLTVFAKNVFKYADVLVPFSLNKAPPQLLHTDAEKLQSEVFSRYDATTPISVNNPETTKNISKKPNESPSSVGDYVSANSTPLVEPTFSSLEKFHTPKGGSPVSLSGIENLEKDVSYLQSEADYDSSKESPIQRIDYSPSSSEDSAPASEDSSSKEGQTNSTKIEDPGKHQQISLFLKDSDCPYIPHVIDMIKLDSATVLIIVSVSKNAKHVLLIYQILRSLKVILEKEKLMSLTDSNFMSKLYEKLDNNIKTLTYSISNQVDLQYEVLARNIAVLKQRWESAKQNELKAFLESSEDQEMPARLYSSIIEVVKGIKSVFSFIFILSKPMKQARFERQMRILSQIHEMAVNRLSDYSSFLQVRGQRNVTMTAYHNDFPGLVHYIYINRTSNQLISPSINQQTSLKSSMQHRVKQHVWQMWQYAESHVSQGFSSFILKDGEFKYSYFIWFEDAMGKPMPVLEIPKRSFVTILTGATSGDFYKDLVRHCFPGISPDSMHCYELFCVHVGIASNRFVAASCKKLASQLWEASGEASSPIGLL